MERTERLELFTLVMMHGMLSGGALRNNLPHPDDMDEFIVLSESAVAMADALGSALDRALAPPPAP